MKINSRYHGTVFLILAIYLWAEFSVSWAFAKEGKPAGYQDTQAGITVEAFVTQTDDGILKVEFISRPPGKVRLVRAELTSPEGVVYAPKDIYEISEEAARNLGRLRPIPALKEAPKKSAKSKWASALTGAALSTALSGIGSSHPKSAYDSMGHTTYAASGSRSTAAALGLAGGATPLLLSRKKQSADAGAEGVQWLEPVTAGTGIFSSVAEFELPAGMDSSAPLSLAAVFDQMNGWVKTYSFVLPPFLFTGTGPAYSSDELEALKKRERELEEEYQKALEEFQRAKEALEKKGPRRDVGVQVGWVPPNGSKPQERKKFEPQDELEKDFLDKLEAVKRKEKELQKAALEREAAEKKLKEAQAKMPQPQAPPVKPPAAGVPVPAAQQGPAAPAQGPCGFFEKKLLRTVETEWRPKGGRDFALPGRDPVVIVVWEKDIGNEFEVTGHCPLPVNHAGPHTPKEIVYEKVRTITQEESYPPGTRRPKPPPGLGLPKKT